MKPSYILLMIAGSVVSLNGQQTFSGPASGYVFDTVGHSVRAFLGIPGAAYLGSPLGPTWDLVSVAPNGNRALGVIGLSIDLIPDLSQPASFTNISQLPGPISRIEWSGDSATAAIWSSTARQLWRITGLDSTPAVHDPIDLNTLAGVLSGWSLSPDGLSLALSISALGTASVYLSNQDVAPVLIGSIAESGAVAFSVDGSSLFVFSAAKSEILRLNLPSGAIAGSFDASPFESTGGVTVAGTGIREPRPSGRRPDPSAVQDLAASPDGSRLYAIGGGTLCGYDVSTGQMLSCTSLEIAPGSFQPMPGGILLLNYPRAGSTPLWLLDAKAGQIYFVPSGSASADASF